MNHGRLSLRRAQTTRRFLTEGPSANRAFPIAGILFDRTPGTVDPIDFKLDVLSEDYAKMWPRGEQWCQELEVFHNPMAAHPIDLELLPGATHWFEADGEIICSTMWKNSVLSSVTNLNLKRPKAKKP